MSLAALAGGVGCCAVRLLGGRSPAAFLQASGTARPELRGAVRSAGMSEAPRSPASGVGASGWVSAAALSALAVPAAMSRRRRAATALQATPQQVPVLNLEGKQVGEETLNLRTLSKDTANYVVHSCATIWEYQQGDFSPFVKRRSDNKKGKKPWKQKGSGRARHGSRYSPLFGKSVTNKGPHGMDDKRRKKIDRSQHYKAISTVLQSKWKCMKIIDGLEDWSEPRQKEMEECLSKWANVQPGEKSMLMITRKGFGQLSKRSGIPTPESYESPLYMSSRLIPRLVLRRPRDIDPTSDGLFQALKGRRLFISREAFFDLSAKFGAEDGWAFKSERNILVDMLQDLVKEYPVDRAGEIEVARGLPRSQDLREFWAKEKREGMALDAVA